MDMYFGAIIHVIPLDWGESRAYTIKDSDMGGAIKSARAYLDQWLTIYSKNASMQAEAKAVIRKAIQPKDVKKEKESLKHAAASKLSYGGTDVENALSAMKTEEKKNSKKTSKNKKEDK